MNLPLCVSELIKNSLDANSKSIIIRINKSRNIIQVIDNGSGMLEEDLSNICKIQNKTKDLQSTKYGKNNEFLKQIINLSDELIIESFMHGFKTSFVKCFKKNQCLDQIERKTQARLNPGTTITIKNIKLNSSSDQDIKIIIETVKEFSILHYDVSFSIRDHFDSQIIFGCKRTSNLLERLKLTFNNPDSSIELITCRKDSTVVNLFICSQLHCLSNLQFIFINKIRFLNREFSKFVNNTLSTVLKVVERLQSRPVYLLQIEFTDSNHDAEQFDSIVKNCILKCVEVYKDKLTNKSEIMELIVKNVEQLPKDNMKTRLERCHNWLSSIPKSFEVSEALKHEISPAPNFGLPDENIIPSITKLKSQTRSKVACSIPVPEKQYFPVEKSKEELAKVSPSKIEYFIKSEEVKLKPSFVLESHKNLNDLRMKKVASEFQKLFPKVTNTFKNKTVKSLIDEKKKKVVLNEIRKPITNLAKPQFHPGNEIKTIRAITKMEPIIKSPEKSFKFNGTRISSARKTRPRMNDPIFFSNKTRRTEISEANPIPVRITERKVPAKQPTQHITYNINSNCTMNIYTNCPQWPGASFRGQNQLLPPMFNDIKNEEPSKIYEI